MNKKVLRNLSYGVYAVSALGENVRLHRQQYYADYFFPCNFSCQYES